ncbi:MAG: hypothetical protein ACLFOC_05255 [Campylobacterales bacterium]
MNAIEFEVDITNRFIEIKEYEKVANRHAKVILLFDATTEESRELGSKRFEDFLKTSQNVENFERFSREELNER